MSSSGYNANVRSPERSSGAVAGSPRGHHIFWTYASDDEHRRVLTNFLLEGLSKGERVCYFGFGGSEERILAALRGTEANVPDLLRSGRLMAGSAVDGYMPGGSFDPDARIAGFETLALETLDEGYPGLRVAAETAWLLTDADAVRAWPAYELRADLLTARLPIVGLCSFDARGADPAVLAMLASLHRDHVDPATNTSTFRIHATGSGSLAIEGALDATFAGLGADAIVGALGDLPAGAIDVHGCDVIDADGLQAIARLVDAIDARGQAPMLNGVSPAFRRLWARLDLDPSRRAALI